MSKSLRVTSIFLMPVPDMTYNMKFIGTFWECGGRAAHFVEVWIMAGTPGDPNSILQSLNNERAVFQLKFKKSFFRKNYWKNQADNIDAICERIANGGVQHAREISPEFLSELKFLIPKYSNYIDFGIYIPNVMRQKVR